MTRKMLTLLNVTLAVLVAALTVVSPADAAQRRVVSHRARHVHATRTTPANTRPTKKRATRKKKSAAKKSTRTGTRKQTKRTRPA